jgi:glucose-6-phosphate isomerase
MCISPSSTTTAWRALQDHFEDIHDQHLNNLFQQDPARADRFCLDAAGIRLDYSKNRCNDTTLELLFSLARVSELDKWIDRLFSGDPINHTEQRSVLHTALRNRSSMPVMHNGKDVMPEVNGVLQRMQEFSDQLREGQWLGATGKRITDVVHIGIGGSDMGPRLVYEALAHLDKGGIQCHFLSNVDGEPVKRLLARLNPESTLFIVASKSFTSLETLINASTARQWLTATLPDAAVAQHFVAVSSNVTAAAEFGIPQQNIFAFWDWVGGRYSLWSAIGLVIAIQYGMDVFLKLLDGAHVMDAHFQSAAPDQNMPIILGLLGIWYINFFACQSHAILPYASRLALLPPYIRQMDMESNGKSVDRDGKPVNWQTAPVIWGDVGTDGQHSFYQLLQQGTPLVPCDFIAVMHDDASIGHHHDALVANCLAQAESLMKGRTEAEVHDELTSQGLASEDVERLLPYRVFAGNRPSNMLLLESITPQSLGALIALYEHKVFVQSVIWNINAFDQWGVELGKVLAGRISREIEEDMVGNEHDSSTRNCLRYYLDNRKK